MGGLSLWHWIIVLLVVVLLFGRGRISDVMGDFGKGVKSFKQGLADDETKPAPPPQAAQIPAPPADSTATSTPADVTRNGQ